MKLLIDTHVLIWWLGEVPRLRPVTRQKIAEADVFVSVVSCWEIVLKKQLKKLEAPDDLEYQLQRHGFHVLPVKLEHVLDIENLPLIHGDPFDRLIVAQARVENMVLVTSDRNLKDYDVAVIQA